MTVVKVGEREFPLKVYTRGIAHKQQDIMLDGVDVDPNTNIIGNIPAVNAEKGNQFLVEAMTGLSTEEVDNMPNDDYEKLKTAIDKYIKGEKK